MTNNNWETLSTLDYTTTCSNTELSRQNTDQNKTPSSTPRKASTMHPLQSESSTNDIQKSPYWEKVERPVTTPLVPHNGCKDASVTYGPFVPASPGYSGASVEELDERQTEAKKNMEHTGMSLTACYDNGCVVHISKKQGRWFLRERQIYTIYINLPYQTRVSFPPSTSQPPKRKHGNTREMHARKVSSDKCIRDASVAQLIHRSQLMDLVLGLVMSHNACDEGYESNKVRVEGTTPV